MSHWRPGQIITLRERVDARITRFFNEYEVAWVIARHSDYIYFKIKWKHKEDLIARCLRGKMKEYFEEKMFHEEMPFVNGPFKDIKIFPDDFFLDMAPAPHKASDE